MIANIYSNDLFNNIDATACGLVFSLYIYIEFMKSRKINSTSLSIYRWLFTLVLIVSIFKISLCITEFIYTDQYILTKVIGRIYNSAESFTLMTYAVYLIFNVIQGTEKEKSKKIKKYAMILYSLCTIANIISLFLPLELNRTVNGQLLFETGGPGCSIAYYCGVVPLVIMTILTLTVFRKRIDNEYLKAILITSLGIVVAFINLLVLNNALAITSIMYQYIAISLYLTNERSSIKLIKETNESLELLKETQLTQEQFLNTVSHDIRSSLNVILGLSEGIIENRNEKEINTESQNITSSISELETVINKTNLVLEILINKNNIESEAFNIDDIINDFTEENILFYKDPTMISSLFGEKNKIKDIITLITKDMRLNGSKNIRVEMLTSNAGSNLSLDISIISDRICYQLKEVNQELNDYLRYIVKENNSLNEDKIMNTLLAKDIVETLKGTIEFEQNPTTKVNIKLQIKEAKATKGDDKQ